jgi:PAS domain S-box-containing protein
MERPPTPPPERFDPFNMGTAVSLRRATPVIGYGAALLSVLAALAISRQFIDIFVQNPFMLFFAAVIITAWYGGTQAAILAIVLSVLLSNYFLIAPFGGFSLDATNLVRSGGFTLVAVLITSIYSNLQRSRRAIHQQREWFLTTIASIGDGVIATDAQQKVMFLNAVATELTGWSPQEAFGKDIQRIFPIINEQTRQPVENPVRRVLRDGTIVGLANHTVLVSRDGRERAIADSGAPIRDTNGEIVGAVLVFRDVTEERQQETRLKQNEERLCTVLENMPVLLLAVDANEQVAAWNYTAESLTGYSAGEMIGVPGALDRLFASAEAREQVLSDKAYAERETELKCKDGQKRIIAWSNTAPAFSVQGWARWVVGVDVTERVLAQRHVTYLAEVSKVLGSSLEYETTLNIVAQISVPAIADWCRIDLVDETGAARLVAVAHVDSQKVSWVYSMEARYPPDPASPRGLYQVIRSGQSEYIGEFTDAMLAAAVPDEERRRIIKQLGYRSIMIVPLTVRGRTIGAVTYITAESGRLFSRADLTLAEEVAQRSAVAVDNARLFRQVRELAAVEERQRLARDLHDAVSQTLFSANIIAQALPRLWGRRPDIVTQRLDELRRLNSGALAEMRTLLLELRSEGIQNIALPELLKQLRDAFQSRKRLDIALDISFAEQLPPTVHKAFYRIAQEALNNVVKHSAATQVTVALTADETCVTLRIQDNGRGFESSEQGAGFGLNIMRERAQEAGATLDVASTLGTGTTVVVIWMRNTVR